MGRKGERIKYIQEEVTNCTCNESEKIRQLEERVYLLSVAGEEAVAQREKLRKALNDIIKEATENDCSAFDSLVTIVEIADKAVYPD